MVCITWLRGLANHRSTDCGILAGAAVLINSTHSEGGNKTKFKGTIWLTAGEEKTARLDKSRHVFHGVRFGSGVLLSQRCTV